MSAPNIASVIFRAGLAKLNECRAKCPGIGGDVDAANLRWLIEHNATNAQSAADQAARTLEGLASGLNIDAAAEVQALRQLPVLLAAPQMLAALESVLIKWNPETGRQLERLLGTHTVNLIAQTIKAAKGGAS